MRYFIIGFKSSGKTTLGRKLAHRLNMDFIDLDHWIEKKEGINVPDLYSKIGDEEFRMKEWEALKEVILKEDAVISLGGGAPCHCDNMKLMEESGKVIYLRLDNDTLVSRLKSVVKNRPIVLNKTEEELREYVRDLKNRCEHHYLRANYIIDGKDLTIEKVLEILKPQKEQ
jgi:shikimate kinase